MKSLIIALACVSFLSTALPAAAPHPTLLTAQYKKELLPVVKVIGTDPVVVLNGKEKRIRTQCVFMPQRTGAFGAGYVEIAAKKVSTQAALAVRQDYGTPGTIYFEAELKSADNLHGGYIMIVATKIGSGAYDATLINTNFVVRQLPDLPAGMATKMKFQQSLVNGDYNMDHFVQIFDANGREIPTNESAAAWKYYALLELVQLRDALPRYLEQYAGQDHDPFPAVQPRPLLPDRKASLPAGLQATLSVSAQGRVEKVTVAGLDDPGALQAVTEALEGWLFFPRLTAGQPVPCTVEVTVES